MISNTAFLPFRISGLGSYLPENVVYNNDLPKALDTSDEWIYSRVGIKSRHIIADDQAPSDMAVESLNAALEDAKMKPNDLDAIICATTTPDLYLPSTATIIQYKIGMTRGFAFDVQAVCSGFLYAINIAASLLNSLKLTNIAIIGVDAMSKIVDWQDRSSCVLFGDGAASMIISTTTDSKGILATNIASDGSLTEILKTKYGVGTKIGEASLIMNGKEVFRHAVEKMAAAILLSLSDAGLNVEDLDLLIAHQANVRILRAIAQKIAIKEDKVVFAIEDVANTSAATIGIAMDRSKSKLKNKIICLVAAGAGFTWGCTLIKV